MTWTHIICYLCWIQRNPDREPVRIVEAIRRSEPCCFCGNLNDDGIYVRHDPRQLSCTHEEDK